MINLPPACLCIYVRYYVYMYVCDMFACMYVRVYVSQKKLFWYLNRLLVRSVKLLETSSRRKFIVVNLRY
jgi:hypothetical protein